MAREITISASTRPVCSSFFKIREQDSEYQSMEEFTYTHSEIDNSLLQKCFIKYRDKDELTYEQYVERFHEFVGTMRFVKCNDRIPCAFRNRSNKEMPDAASDGPLRPTLLERKLRNQIWDCLI